MKIIEETILKAEHVDDDGRVLAVMSVTLEGDGSTPNVQTSGKTNIIGYSDDGMPIIANLDEKKLASDQAEFMKAAIAKQKELTSANGIDPSVVNIIGAENEVNQNGNND